MTVISPASVMLEETGAGSPIRSVSDSRPRIASGATEQDPVLLFGLRGSDKTPSGPRSFEGRLGGLFRSRTRPAPQWGRLLYINAMFRRDRNLAVLALQPRCFLDVEGRSDPCHNRPFIAAVPRPRLFSSPADRLTSTSGIRSKRSSPSFSSSSGSWRTEGNNRALPGPAPLHFTAVLTEA